MTPEEFKILNMLLDKVYKDFLNKEIHYRYRLAVTEVKSGIEITNI